MKKAAAVPDAWDDDWESQADGAAQQNARPARPPSQQRQQQQRQQAEEDEVRLTKAQRLVQHAEANRKLWESADAPQTFHYLEASNNVPLTSAFKPQVKVLSRKPVVARDPVTGMARLAVDDDDDDDDGGGKKAAPLSPEQIRAKQKRDREEKQRRYDEARAKIFGDSASSSRGSSPGTVTPPRPDGRHHHAAPPGRGRGRGGGAPRTAAPDGRQPHLDTRRQNNQSRELFDPNCSSKPDAAPQRRGAPDADPSSSSSSSRGGPPQRDEPQQPIRMPMGPDGSGRGGAGFVRRGAKGSR